MCLFVEAAGIVNEIYSMSHMCAIGFKYSENGTSGVFLYQPGVLETFPVNRIRQDRTILCGWNKPSPLER